MSMLSASNTFSRDACFTALLAIAAVAGFALFQPTGAVPSSRAETVDAGSSPGAPSYEAVFFDALNFRPDRRDTALAEVRSQVHRSPDDARAVLLLGMAHLWCAAETPPCQEESVEHLVLARHYLERASRLNPGDDRIPSWLLSAEIGLAESEGRAEDAAASLAKLLEHAQRDPCFHSIAYAISVWEGPRDRAELLQAQQLLEAAAACSADNPSARNMGRWPHNIEGFLTGLSDVALKRGDRDRAMACLVSAEAWPGAETWPHNAEAQDRRREFDERAARFADDDPSNDPPFIFERGGPVSCISCHQSHLLPAH